MKKLLVVDGHSILNRAFYGIPSLTNREGIPTNAIYGFLNIVFKVIEEEVPDYFAVAFDLSAPTFRHKMYDAYKGTRKPMDPDLKQQVPLMKEMLKAMGVTVMEKEGYEADDLLGTVARIGEKEGCLVTVLSGDRDLLQLATDKVKIRIPKTKKGGTEIEDYNAADVVETYGVTPAEFIEVKALQGDSSDNIPGLPGVGPKTATALVQQYHTVEEIIAHADDVKPPKAQTALKENIDSLRLCRKLVEIDTNAEFEFSLSDAEYKNLYTPEAFELCKKYEFKNFLGRFEKTEESAKQAEETFEILTDMEEKTSAINALGDVFSFALNENGLAIYDGKVCRVLLFAMGLERPMLLPLLEEKIKSAKKVYVTGLKELLKEVWIPKEVACDVALYAYVLDSSRSGYDERNLAVTYGNFYIPEGKDVASETVLGYFGKLPLTVAKTLEDELNQTGSMKLYEEIELPLAYVLYDMEQEGINLDKTALAEYGKNLQSRMDELEGGIYEGAGESFNINSPKQLGEILFEKLEIPGGKKTKTGYSTSADVLEKLAPDYPFVRDILEYRQLAKLKSTYADGLASFVASDGKIHCHFQQTVTATGRLSCTDPNLQNIPIRMELGRQIRKLFYPKAGYVYVDADYSQIELRILAHLSKDEVLQEAFISGKDVHKDTASKVYGIGYDEVTDMQRRAAKVVNFGIIYGMSSFGLSEDLHITRKEAKAFTETYFETYPKIKAYLDGLIETAREKGYVESLYGRRRMIPDINNSNFMKRSFSERVAMNSPIQGTAADIMKIAMLRVHERLIKDGFDAKVLVQVHDELLLEVKEDQKDAVTKALCEEMEKAASLAVPLEVDAHSGNTWYEAK